MVDSVANSTAAIEDPSKPPKREPSLQLITYGVTKTALSNQLGQQKKELQKLKISHNFVKNLNELRAMVKPDGENALVIGSRLADKLTDVKNYAISLEENLNDQQLPESTKQEMIEEAKALVKRAEKIIEDIEKDNLTPETRRDVRDDLDSAIKELNEENSMQLNMATKVMNNLHEMYAMARTIIRTVSDVIRNFTRKIDSR